MNSSTHRPWHWLYRSMALSAALVLGCGDGGPKRYPVSGTVTFGGNRVEYGTIVFQPDASVGTLAPSGYARIENGAYRTAPDQSPTSGRYTVRVMGFDKSKMKANAAPGEIVETPLLFPDFVMTVEVPPPDGQLNIEVPAASSPSRSGR